MAENTICEMQVLREASTPICGDFLLAQTQQHSVVSVPRAVRGILCATNIARMQEQTIYQQSINNLF